MRYLITGICLVALILSGCSSGKKALKKGDYDRAVLQAVKRLRSDTDNENATNTLKAGYKYALDDHKRKIQLQLSGSDAFKWEKVIGEYEAINRLHDEIRRCPACLNIVSSPEYMLAPLNEAKEKAAANRYALAEEALKEKQNRNKAIEAHQHLQRVNGLVQPYRNTDQLINEALYYATLKVVVEPIPAPTRVLRLNQEFFNNKVNEYLHRNAINQYVRFYTPREVESENLEWVDHRIQMNFDQFTLGNIISHTEIREVSRDSVLISEEGGKEIYGTVKAELKTYEKAIIGAGILDFQIMDVNLKKVISQEKFPSEYRWGIVWASYNGDERALSEEQLDLVNQRELPIPNPQFMFEEFAAPLFDQTIRKISDYYRNY